MTEAQLIWISEYYAGTRTCSGRRNRCKGNEYIEIYVKDISPVSKHHDRKAYRGHDGTAPRILEREVLLRTEVTFTPRKSHSRRY